MRMLFRLFSAGVFLVLLFSSVPLCAQERNEELDTRLTLKEHVMDGEFMRIKYEIPFDGMVEIRLYNEQDELVWRSQYIQTIGENEIRLRANRLPAGTYTYELSYKGNKTHNSFTVSGSGG